MINELRSDGSFGRAHRLGLYRGLLFLIFLAIPIAIGAGTHHVVHHAFEAGVAPWLAR